MIPLFYISIIVPFIIQENKTEKVTLNPSVLLFLYSVIYAVKAVCLLELINLIDNAENNVKAEINRFGLKAVGHIAPGVIIVSEHRVLGREGNGLDARSGHRR